MADLWIGNELDFLVRLGICLVFGTAIGIERELRNKPAGISTHAVVMAGSCLFSFASVAIDHGSPARIAAQVVSGVGFLGAGMILKSEGNVVRNLTTAASVWFSAAVGMVIGFGWYITAAVSTVYAIIVPRLPDLRTWRRTQGDE
ncbi:MAG: MgtC/SapB family protein [Kofleriaceae bacterium]